MWYIHIIWNNIKPQKRWLLLLMTSWSVLRYRVLSEGSLASIAVWFRLDGDLERAKPQSQGLKRWPRRVWEGVGPVFYPIVEWLEQSGQAGHITDPITNPLPQGGAAATTFQMLAYGELHLSSQPNSAPPSAPSISQAGSSINFLPILIKRRFWSMRQDTNSKRKKKDKNQS